MRVECNACEKTTELKRDPDALDRVLLAALKGWRFDTENGWRCADHFSIDNEEPK